MPFDSNLPIFDDSQINMTSQLALEEMFSKYQLISCIQEEFINANFGEALDEAEIDQDFGIALMTQLVLHKRSTIPILVGILKKHFEDSPTSAQDCADGIYKMAAADFVDWEDMTQNVIMKYDISDDTKKRLDMFQYPLPMIVEPEQVTHNKMTGYQSIKGSLLLRNNHHEDDICLDHINRSNAVPLTLNADVVAFVQNKWKNLDKRKPDEEPEDFKRRVRAFEKYDESSRDVLSALMAQGDRFWLTHKYDKRGRVYCQGYHVSYQSHDWNKAVILFADGETLNEI